MLVGKNKAAVTTQQCLYLHLCSSIPAPIAPASYSLFVLLGACHFSHSPLHLLEALQY